MSIIDDLQSSLDAMSNAVVAATDRKVQNAFTADNALGLNGQTASQLLASAAAHTDAHASRTDNPHNTQAADINAYTTAQVDALISGLLPNSVLPMSRYGDLSASSIAAVVDPSAGTVTFPANIPAMMAGQTFKLSGQVVSLATTSADNYLYLRMVSGTPTYVAVSSPVAESSTNMLLGVVNVTGGTVNKNTIAPVSRIDIYRPSTTPAGSAFPVTTGDPSQAAQLPWY